MRSLCHLADLACSLIFFFVLNSWEEVGGQLSSHYLGNQRAHSLWLCKVQNPVGECLIQQIQQRWGSRGN